jgi:hypothetical protein
MPPITLHMVIARRLAEGLGDASLLTDERGPYLLGATTPDIRVLTRQDRYSTHFFDLSKAEHQDSVAGFFTTHGRLLERTGLTAATQAFVAGYISHLALDEEYITGVYRRFFLPHDELGGRIRANVMDRLLQFDLERSHGADPEMKQHLAEALSCTVEGIEAGFVDGETLERWRKVAYDVSQRRMDWDRMRSMVANHLRFAGLEQGETLTEFLDSLPDLLDETIAHVTSAEIDGYLERSTAAAYAAVTRYLGCG